MLYSENVPRLLGKVFIEKKFVVWWKDRDTHRPTVRRYGLAPEGGTHEVENDTSDLRSDLIDTGTNLDSALYGMA